MKHILIFIIVTCFYNFNAFSVETFDSWYEGLSDNEKVSQLFVTGVKSKALTSKERKLLKKWPVGVKSIPPLPYVNVIIKTPVSF